MPYPVYADGQPASALGGENFAIFESSDNVGCAWDFIAYTQDPSRIVDFYVDLGYLPSRADIAESDAASVWTDDPLMAVFVQEVANARPRGPIENWAGVSEAIQDMLQEALSGQVPPEQAIRTAQQKIDAILAE
ncbi:MAG: extracellular solute-binding protein [Chloroflexi bacterium]|nr:extracellular solute-binding protein [Chloroflexota bacterium]